MVLPTYGPSWRPEEAFPHRSKNEKPQYPLLTPFQPLATPLPMPFLRLFRDDKEVLCFPLEQERVTVGRDEECDLQLTDPALSRQHFDLTWDGQGYTLSDYSQNGTFVDGERIDDDCPIVHDQRIEIGPFVLQYCEGGAPKSEETIDTSYQPTLVRKYEPEAQELSIEQLHLTVHTKGGPQEYTVDRLPLSIGGASQNTITIQNDPYISRTHCIIESNDTGLTLRDCASRNGTWWGDSQVSRHTMPERGKFQVGNTEISFHIEQVKEAIKPAGQQRFGEMLGISAEMQKIFSLVARVAPSHASVLIEGASGTGKELLARAVHAASGRAHRPFVALNCGALPATVIESELFGHERGAFTGANAQHKGVFEQAAGGSIFLDEIGEMPLDLQTHLLRVLESRTLRRVGGTSEVSVDVRVIAATNRSLSAMVAEGSFREDLFYRLCIVPIAIPPLCERPEDIVLLAKHFLRILRGPQGPARFSEDALRVLQEYAWPGNARELRHTVERTLIIHQEPIITAEALMFTPHTAVNNTPPASTLEEHERNAIEHALRTHRGNVSIAAQELGISRSTLTVKVKRLGIDIHSIRQG